MGKDKAPKKDQPVKGEKPPKEQKVPKGEKAPKEQKAHGEEKGIAPRLEELFAKSLTPELMKRFKYTSVMEVPRLHKISVNVGVGAATQDAKILDTVVKDLESIVGQKPVITKAKKAISNFKLREGLPIGVRVTLRRKKMYEFMDRFVAVAVPRIRDFRGFSDRSFDGRGNYTVGVKEQIIFPEIDVDKISRVFGMDITFVTTARTDQEALELLKGLGFPFIKREESVPA
jgi:large subunit ribosomal protein L5